MRRPSLRKTTLLSLLGLTTKSSTTTIASAQSTPSSTSLANLTSFSPSTETLVPTSTASDTETAPALPTSDFAFTVSLEQPTGNGTTLAGTGAGAGQTTSGARFSATGSNTAVVYMGEAVPTGYRKIGLAGALAGAAGVFMV
ncbi:hypothetical protein PMIN06_003788 [Paraphaeosphaeria minitans]|uniref:Uncharacterized protein n=1 Tax=Paraphaeosphaeria minitans TaxID=565426 RepID=A0A9P6GL61_9PLEO|nr:hypothetical protein PMIN01_06074 [Paraphaeosphaeria minitans]